MKVKTVSWCNVPVNVPGLSFDKYESEDAFQIYCATWLRKEYIRTGNRKFKYWHHSANERSSGSEGHRAKLKGQEKGFPDFINCELQIAIELKVQGRKPSKKQNEWLDYFSDIKWSSHVIYRFEDFKQLVQLAI